MRPKDLGPSRLLGTLVGLMQPAQVSVELWSDRGLWDLKVGCGLPGPGSPGVRSMWDPPCPTTLLVPCKKQVGRGVHQPSPQVTGSSAMGSPMTLGVLGALTHPASPVTLGPTSSPCRYLALYAYKPQKSDELELRRGETYRVLEKCQDGWFKGASLRTGISGVFPGNYVTPVSR